jgi:hypothetical protein
MPYMSQIGRARGCCRSLIDMLVQIPELEVPKELFSLFSELERRYYAEQDQEEEDEEEDDDNDLDAAD